MDRRFPKRPLVGVGAILLSSDLTHVLLIQRGKPPAQGSWTLPGGLLEIGETARQACSREIQEETGLIIGDAIQDLAVVAERIIEDAEGKVEYHYLILDFWGKVEMHPVRGSSDAQTARWIPIEQVPSLETTRGVYQAILRTLALARDELPRQPVFSE